MALTISELNSVSKRFFDETMTQEAYDSSPLFAKLKDDNQVTQKGGVDIQWPIRYRKLAMADAVGPRQQVHFQSKTTRTGAVLDWTYYLVPGTLHWDEKLKNSGVGKIVDLVADKTQEMADDIKDDMSTALFATTQGSSDLRGLDEIVDAGDTYAGIAVADDSNWAAQEDTTKTQLIIWGEYSLTYYRNRCTFGKNHPTLHITTKDLLSKYESILQPQQRYTEDPQMKNLGFQSVSFYGKPVVQDEYCTTKYWYGLDTKQFELRVHPDYNFDTGEGWFSLKPGFPYAAGRVIAWAGNLMCRMRKTSFKMTLLDYTL
jgi:hypothetical protein